MAQALQHHQTALIAELPTTGAADTIAPNASSGSERINAVVFIPLVQNKNIRRVTPLLIRFTVKKLVVADGRGRKPEQRDSSPDTEVQNRTIG